MASEDVNTHLQKLNHFVQYVGLTFLIVVLWQGLFHLGYLNPLLLPPPTQVALAFWDLLKTGALPRHIGISILRVLEGYAIAAVLGLSLGTAIGLSRNLDRWTDLIIQVVKPIPPIAWIPLAILWFGIGEQSKVYIIFMGAIFPIIINTIDGIRQTDHKFVEVARILAVPRLKFVRQVVLPGALPAIMTGLRVGLMVAWICVVAAELIAASSGVGYLIMDARQLSQSDVVLVGMITIGIIGKLMDSFIRRLERRLISWKVAFAGN
jgi:sulfonate transport system permease protein